MALLHHADISPTKLELLAAWLPTRDWFRGPADTELTRVAAGRLDDPDGEVGLEVLLIRAGDGPIHHTPLTYRGAPLSGADASCLGTMDHSVLGTRWVYDAPADPVYAAVLATTSLTGAHEAEEWVEDAAGNRVQREPMMSLRGSGATTTMDNPGLEVVRVLDPTLAVSQPHLVGAWPEDGRSYVLAFLDQQ